MREKKRDSKKHFFEEEMSKYRASSEQLPPPPIQSLAEPYVRYAMISHQLDELRRQTKILSLQQKKIGNDVRNLLQQRPGTRQQFAIDQTSSNLVQHFGNSFIGFRLYTRRRDQIFNSKTFGQAMLKHCTELLEHCFPATTQDERTHFAEQLATLVWTSRTSVFSEDIVLLRKRAPKKEQQQEARKRKPEIQLAPGVKHPNVMLQGEDGEEEQDDEEHKSDSDSEFD